MTELYVFVKWFPHLAGYSNCDNERLCFSLDPKEGDGGAIYAQIDDVFSTTCSSPQFHKHVESGQCNQKLKYC